MVELHVNSFLFQAMEHTSTCNIMIFFFVSGLCEGVQLDVYYPGFPTLYHVPHKVQFYIKFKGSC